MQIDLKAIAQQVEKIAQGAGEFIKQERLKISPNDIQLKGKASLVTYVDQQTERMLVEKLKNIFPAAKFITEEETTKQESGEYNWIIDPLDGTTNFIHGLYPHSISIALCFQHKPILGVIHEIGANETFSAWKDGGAFLNGNPIHVSKTSNHTDALLATGFPYYDFSQLDNYLQLLRFFMIETRGMRRMGSAAVDLAYVACGRFDGFFEHALHAWDVAAGIIIVQEAGGIVSDFNGGNNFLFGGEIVAASQSYFEAFSSEIKKHLG
ncbi:MAG: inositol monophosphatase family protein [Mangrovibacterium sp.]